MPSCIWTTFSCNGTRNLVLYARRQCGKVFLLGLSFWALLSPVWSWADESNLAATPAGVAVAAQVLSPGNNVGANTGVTNALVIPTFVVTNFQVRGEIRLSTNEMDAILSNHTGTNLTLLDIVKAASDVLLENRHRGNPPISIAIAEQRITNGVVMLNVFKGNSQVLVSGRRYPLPAAAQKTNAPTHFPVTNYEITGDSILSDETLTAILTKYTSTNATVDDVIKAASELQLEYRTRGFPTVNVTLPPQQITNGIVKIRVFVGRLSEINVTGNRYFSSNNVMGALPSLRTNIILNSSVFQSELDRANANQDRQIYGQLEPGEVENTTRLDLTVKDRLPLHGKIELSNQSSPGTPDLRINSSAAYNNLWQLEHALGVQYSFSPEAFKSGDQWDFYDLPLVANYSAFYRLPLSSQEAVAGAIAAKPGTFGYDEATRRFNLPPSSGRAELNLYASRSTIDTGIMSLGNKSVLDIPRVISINQEDSQQDLTVNNALGTRLSLPVGTTRDFQSSFSGGLDYKSYSLTSFKTNTFLFSITTRNQNGGFNPPVTAAVASPVPATVHALDYLPLAFRYDASLHDKLGSTSFGLGLNVNTHWTGTLTNLQNTTGSKESSGYWVILNPSVSRDFLIRTNWTLSARADGQWASEPLISNEQFGNGGVASIRGYREGEVFGDTGWRVSLELKTPAQLIGRAYGKHDLRVRGSLYMDYGETYFLDPQGRDARTPLLGTGLGAVATLGSTWDFRLLFSWPLLGTTSTPAYQPFFNFALTSQF
jgi:hemolysin activation/secretion protein